MLPLAEIDFENDIVTIDNGKALVEMSIEDALKLFDSIQHNVAKHKVRLNRKDFKYEGNSI